MHLAIMLLAFVVAVTTQPSTQPGDSDLRLMQGTWVIETATLAGKPFPEPVAKITTLTIKDESYLVMVGQSPDAGSIRIDPTTSPKSLDITGTEGPNKGKTIPCIYRFTGEKLEICYDLSGKARPAEFKSDAGTTHFWVVYAPKR